MEALFIHTPGLKVVMPSTPYDAKGLLVSSIRDPDPVIFFESEKLYRSIKQEVPTKEFVIPLGKAATRTAGLGAEIAAQINEKALLNMQAPVERVTGFDTVFPLPKLENYYLPDVKRISDAIERVMKF